VKLFANALKQDDHTSLLSRWEELEIAEYGKSARYAIDYFGKYEVLGPRVFQPLQGGFNSRTASRG